MGCKGLHCDGCRGGGGAGAVIALLVIIAVGLRAAWPQIVRAVEIVAWTVAGTAGAVIVITGAVLTVRGARRVRARRGARLITYYPAQIIPAARISGRPAIERGGGAQLPGNPPPRCPARGQQEPGERQVP
jgi:hypothetical protein